MHFRTEKAYVRGLVGGAFRGCLYILLNRVTVGKRSCIIGQGPYFFWSNALLIFYEAMKITIKGFGGSTLCNLGPVTYFKVINPPDETV